MLMLDWGLSRLHHLGFLLDEVMVGEHRFEPGFGDGGDRPMSFRVTWGPSSIVDWLSPASPAFLRHELTGTVTIDGLCAEAPCLGSLELLYSSQHKIRYTFEFDVSGQRLRFVGEKVNIRLWNWPVSHTTCFGRTTQVETGRLVSTSVTYFRIAQTLAFARSFRLRL
jgi:hypothetical protein